MISYKTMIWHMTRYAVKYYDTIMLMIMVPLPIVTQDDSHLDTGVFPANKRFRWPVFSAQWVGKWLVVKRMLLSCWFSLFNQTAHRKSRWPRQGQKMWHCSCHKGTLALPNYDSTLCLRSTSCLRQDGRPVQSSSLCRPRLHGIPKRFKKGIVWSYASIEILCHFCCFMTPCPDIQIITKSEHSFIRLPIADRVARFMELHRLHGIPKRFKKIDIVVVNFDFS